MASTPGILTNWPWEFLGNFKYVIVGPMVGHSIYSFLTKAEDADIAYPLISLLMLWRILHIQIWTSLSRYRTARGDNLIVDRSIEFEQVDRESNWDDQIVFNWIIMYVGYWGLKSSRNMPLWRTDGVLLMSLMHAGPVEFLYYWFHRALHHHFLYSRYHSHHHSSIVTEPTTSVVHPFAEHIAYYIIFGIPVMTILLSGVGSMAAVALYVTYFDLMNNMGHCNFVVIPNSAFTLFPPLKYLIYTPYYHSLHHTQFRTNYALFMPFYDYIYETMDKSYDTLYETSLKKPEDDVPQVVHLTHLTTPQSIYHTRLGFASLASKPLTSKWYLWIMWPVTLCSMITTWIYGRTFILETNTFGKIKAQSWAIPRYNAHYLLKWQREAINKLIEEAIFDANLKGIKVLSLGLLNQGEHFNRNGQVYLDRNPKLQVKIVDGSSLAVAVVVNSIPKGTSHVVFRGSVSKVAYSVVSALCHKGIKIVVIRKDEYDKLKKSLPTEVSNNLVLSTKNYNYHKVWLVGENLSELEQSMALKGSVFIPFSQFPPKKTRKDCCYLNTPAMVAPKSFDNLHACENWLPRRAMSAWRVAGILHALEGWNVNECGDMVFDVDKVWEASLHHGFHPLSAPA